VSTTDLDVSVEAGGTTSTSSTLSNTAAPGADNPNYDIAVAASNPAMKAGSTLGARTAEAIAQQRHAAYAQRETRRQAARLDAAQRSAGQHGVDLRSLVGSAPFAGPQTVSYATRGGIDCDAEPGIIIQDDGTVENGYSGNATVVESIMLVDYFTPAQYPATFTSLCVAFIAQAGAPTTMDYEVVFL